MSVVLQQELKKLIGDLTIKKFNAVVSEKNSNSLLHRLAGKFNCTPKLWNNLLPSTRSSSLV